MPSKPAREIKVGDIVVPAKPTPFYPAAWRVLAIDDERFNMTARRIGHYESGRYTPEFNGGECVLRVANFKPSPY